MVGEGIRTPDPLVPNQLTKLRLFTETFRLISQTGPVSYQINGVANEIRTRDHRNHNPGLYQLSYSHHYSLYNRYQAIG